MDVGAPQETQAVISSTTGAQVNSAEVESVAKSWMIDFSFLSLCCSYREQNAEKFSKTLKMFEVLIDDDYQIQDNQQIQRTICCLLSRIMDSKNLDAHYDLNKKVTPLMSAISVWECLKDTVDDAVLYNNVENLLFIQCVGVCLEKGNPQLAAHTLQWLEKETSLPEKLQRKLSTVVSKKDAYDQLLTRFSFNHLLKNVNSFLDKILKKHPSDFLFKKWLNEEDKCLKAGVRKHGEGKWCKILEEFDFGNRTSVMLKDRWRTLKKHGKV
ncbi:telomeric repeat-binding factor 1 isoform X1 [Silurus meridionalis]|nr:telomeric repeat-binding factor 1 isoform X1 [Silurus meridionalis]